MEVQPVSVSGPGHDGRSGQRTQASDNTKMSEVSEIGGQPGTYEEKRSQWFLERSFFGDFVYRNPRGKRKAEELRDCGPRR